MPSFSRQNALLNSGLQSWQRFYQTYNTADFKSYDYATLRRSFLEYLRLNYPEGFTDFTESSEFVALLDIMAFLGQGLAFRNDVNTRENFLDTAERRDSVIKLANLVSYTSKRNIASSGFLKVTAISTTEDITDINGFNLNNQTILWNDPANINWLEQFNTIINAALVSNQRIGRPANTATILGVVTSEYTLSLPGNTLPVIPVNSVVDNIPMTFELTSMTSVGSDSLYEIPPRPTNQFNMLYRTDSRGYGSPNTGFFFAFKQGSLTPFDFTLVQQVANQVIPIGTIEGVNNTDTWLWQFDNNNQLIPWVQTESVYTGISQRETGSDRQVFTVLSGANDTVSYSFGDNIFSKIPVGNFRAYVRASNGLTYQIEPQEMQGLSTSINYISRQGKPETLQITLTLQQSVNNAQSRENINQIKLRAPTRYYTQNRMVNGEDYSNFPFTKFNSIIKSTAINRTSIGTNRASTLVDPTGRYSSVNSFSDDGAAYVDTTPGFVEFTAENVNRITEFLTNTLAEIIATAGMTQYFQQTTSRYVPSVSSGDGTVLWQLSTVQTATSTGYFYIEAVPGTPAPINIGSFNTDNMQYAAPGSLLKLQAPAGQAFDANNHLIPLVPGVPARTTMWTTIAQVIGDGSNGGRGNFTNGAGPVTVTAFVPQGVQVIQIIPPFSNVFPQNILAQAQQLIQLNTAFTMQFNSNLPPSNSQRWTIGSATATEWYIRFTPGTDFRYTVEYQQVQYVFGSVRNTRFLQPVGNFTYDVLAGNVIRDYIDILRNNLQPGTGQSLIQPIKLLTVLQPVAADGSTTDNQITVAALAADNPQIFTDPDWFTTFTGYIFGGQNTGLYVFFERVSDPLTLARYEILPADVVVSEYATLASIEQIKYQYPVGTLFYASEPNLFYRSQQNPASVQQDYTMILQPAGDYLMRPGRNSVNFQYRHNSAYSTLVDPATTNIIDLYLVTNSYSIAYTNWLQDVTNTIPLPPPPTQAELSADYAAVLSEYKMMSDTVVYNSVKFKPILGNKAAPALQGSIKVIRSQFASTISDNEIKSRVVAALNQYFNINVWDFGATFYGSEMTAWLHRELDDIISSVVIVPASPNQTFGDLYQINSAPYEIFVNGVNVNNVIVISANTPSQLRQSL